MACSLCRSFFTALRRASRAIPETPIARETTPTGIARLNPVPTSLPDGLRERFTVHYRYLSEEGEEEIHAAIHHRYMRLQQALDALDGAGLELVVAHGDFDQSVYDSDSERMIITASKRARR